MTRSKIEPVQRRLVVDLGIERAFGLFIERFDAIKPREHNLLSVPIAETVFEPREGGHIYDVGVDGSTRVELEHRNLDRHGDGWRSVADGISGDAGWPLYLRRYAEMATEAAQ
jgi:hypothetical protein